METFKNCIIVATDYKDIDLVIVYPLVILGRFEKLKILMKKFWKS